MVGFYNKIKRYDLQGEAGCEGDECGLDVGTVVNKDRADTIFTKEFKSSNDYLLRLDTESGNYVSVKGRNFGVLNLRKAIENIKGLGAEYVYIHASGNASLIDYYRKLGVEYTIKNVVLMDFGDQVALYDPLLGDIDVILSKLPAQ